MTDRTHPDSGRIITSSDVIADLHARITELESQLAQRFDAADVATAAAQGFRDGVASLTAQAAGSVPAVATLHQIMAAARELHAIDNPDGEPEWAALPQYEVDVWRARAERVLKAAAARAPADSVLEDAARYRYLLDCNSGSLVLMQITGTGDMIGAMRKRIAELESELEAVGAGGVSGPLMARASLSANAGGPVAWQYRSLRDNGAWFDCTKERFEMRCTQPEIWEARALYAAPPTAPAGWKLVPVNPTPEMWKAAKSVPDPNPPYPPHYGLVWDAMLAASP